VLKFGAGSRDGLYDTAGTQAPESCLQRFGSGDWPTQQRNHFINRFRLNRPIARGPPVAYQETNMAHDTVAHHAEARQVNEQSLFEE